MFLGPPENEKPGLPKKSFFDRLDSLPRWDKTRYFCNSFDIYECEFVTVSFAENPDSEKESVALHKR